MLAEFEIIGRIARISDLEGKNGTAALLSVASTESWQKDGAWKEKTYFHTLTVRKGLENVGKDLNVGDLVRFTGEIQSWHSETEGEHRNGVSLVALSRRILARKQSAE